METFLKKNKEKLPHVNPLVWLGLIILFALLTRSYHITYPLDDTHAFRQTQTAGLIRDFYRQGIDLFYPTMITLGNPGYVILEFPLYQAICALLYKLLLQDMIVARLFSILCGLLSIVFIYRLANKFLDRTSALFASLFYALMPLNIFFQRVPMPDPLTIFLSLIMLDFLIEGINNRKTFLLIAGMVAGSLGLIMKSPYVAPLYLPLIYAVFKQNKNARFLLNARLLLSLFVPLAVLALWQRHANAANETYFGASGYPFRELYSVVMVKLKPLNEWYFGTIAQRLEFKNYLAILERIFKEMLSFVGIAAFIPGVFSIIRKKACAFYMIWLLAILLSIMVFFNLNVVHNYYQLPLCPIIAIFCGAGVAYLVSLFRNRMIVIAICIVLMFSFIVISFSISQQLFKKENDLLVVGQFIDKSIEKDVMIATSLPKHDSWSPTLMYYTDRRGFNIGHKRLNEDIIDYFRDNRVKYLAIVDYMGRDSSIDETLCPYKVINENARVSIYDITGIIKTCKKAPSYERSFPVIEFNFENGVQGWRSVGNAQILQDRAKQHEGKASMKIAGTGQTRLYSFAQSGQVTLSPGKRYKLTGFMLIDSISDNTSFFKCELYQDGKWIKNIDSNEYDIARKGQWRQLSAEFAAPEGKNVSVSFTIEKRPMEKDVEAVIFVDEIKLEMIK